MLSSFFKIPVHIQPGFWLLAGLFSWLYGWEGGGGPIGFIMVLGIVIISILVHEYGHALTAVAFRQRAVIELVIYGGVTKRSGKQLKKWQEFVVVLNGPLAGAALAIAVYSILHLLEPHLNSITISALSLAWNLNLIWTAFNLLPVFPLDGGQLLAITLQAFFGLNGLRTALLISTVFSLFVSILLFSASALLPGAIFLMLTFEGYRNWKSSCAMTQTDQNPAAQHQLHLAEMFIQEGDIQGAQKVLEQLILTAKEGVIHNAAVMTLSKLRFQQEDYEGCIRLLLPIAPKLDGQHLELLILSALNANELKIIQQLGSRAYQEYPTYNIALANARCYARLNQATPAIGWLQSAIRDGIPNPKAILHLKDFDSIRHTEAWNKVEAAFQ